MADETTLDGHNKAPGFSYPNIWPASWIANMIVGGVRRRVGETSVIADAVDLSVSTVMTFLFNVVFAVIFAVVRGRLQALGTDAALAALITGLATGLAYYAVHVASHRVTGAYMTLWDTLAFASFGWIGRNTKREFNIAAYLWNWVMAVILLVAIFAGHLAGAASADYFVKDSSVMGAAIPQYGLASRDGAQIYIYIIVTAFYVFVRMYWTNPFVAPQPTDAQVLGASVAAISLVGAFIGTTGAFDFSLPLASALVQGKYTDLWTLVIGQGIGMFVGAAIFFLASIVHSIRSQLLNVGRVQSLTSV